LRLAGITDVESANRFLRDRYIQEFNQKFSVVAAEKGTAFRRATRSDLEWVFTVQTERVVGKDNTVAIGDRLWQIEKLQFRNTLAGSTVIIHEHVDGNVSLRYGPHVVGRYDAKGKTLERTGPTESGFILNLHQSRRSHWLADREFLEEFDSPPFPFPPQGASRGHTALLRGAGESAGPKAKPLGAA
jgi:hypothetical protein